MKPALQDGPSSVTLKPKAWSCSARVTPTWLDTMAASATWHGSTASNGDPRDYIRGCETSHLGRTEHPFVRRIRTQMMSYILAPRHKSSPASTSRRDWTRTGERTGTAHRTRPAPQSIRPQWSRHCARWHTSLFDGCRRPSSM